MAIRFLNSGNISGNLEVNKSANAAVEIAKFKVTGTGGSFGAFSFVSILPGSGNYATQLRLHTNNTGNNFQSINNNAGVLELATNDNNPLVLKTNSTTRLTISNVGAATFTGLVSGITPTAAANFVTKAYADGLAPGAGVFLPLAGGTLTGATATATGISFTVGGHFNANSTTTLGGAVTIEGNLFMDGYNITSIDELSASTGTFSGNIIANKLTTSTGLEYQVRNTNGSSGNHVFKSFNTVILTLDGATNASTFAGELNVKNASSRFISLNYEDSINSIISHNGSSYGLENLNVRGDNIYFYTDYEASSPKGNITLTLQNNHNAKFEGNVGIGISPGTNSLHIYKSNPIALIQAANTSGAAQVQFFPRDASNVAHLQSIKGVDSNLTFSTGGNSGNSYVPTQRMRIDSGGSIMIGGVAPSGTPAADYRSLEIGRQGNTITGAPWKSNLYFSTNATITGGSTTFTARYLNELPMLHTMEDGVFAWSNAVLPTAVGNAVVWNERMRIKSDGNVGIGTTSPVSTWLSGFDPSTGNGTFKLTSEGWMVTPMYTGLAAYYPGQGARPIIWSDAGGTNIQNFDNNTTDGVSIRSSNGTTRLFVKEDGNVGIGNSPASDAKLEVWNGNLRVRGDQNNFIQLSNVGGNTKASLGNAGNEGDLSLYTSGNVKTVYLSSYYNSYINPNGGNLGIGTTSPQQKLQVNGDIGIGEQNGVRASNVRYAANDVNVITFNISVGAVGAWRPGSCWIQVSGSQNGLQEYYSAWYFIRLTHYYLSGVAGQGTTNPSCILDSGGNTSSVVVGVSSTNSSNPQIITITLTDVGATSNSMVADINCTMQIGINSITNS